LDLEAGVVVAQRYRIQRQLGRGGMGEVFAAENIRTGRVVAVKVLRADSKQKSSAVARFRREARAAGAINSDYVTQVLDVEEDAEHGIVIVFELLEGESLIERLKRTGPMTFDELFPIVEGVWMGLADAHKSGVIHRDLKPSNVFLERRPDGAVRVKILDFGISKLPKEVGGDTLTEMGQSLGTFSFMPPEQIGKAKTVDHRADIYACATLIYQAMSGQLPYAAKNILQMVDLKTKSEPRPLSAVLDGPADPRLEAFLQRGLAREPSDRFQSAQEALDAWRALKRPTGGPVLAGAAAPSAVPAGYAEPARQSYGAPSQPLPQGGMPQSGMQSSQQPMRPSPATVMMNDPRSSQASPGPQYPYGSQQQGYEGQRKSLGGTVAIPDQSGGRSFSPQPFQSPVYGQEQRGGVPKVSGVPVLNDTSSEGVGDQIATIAMPRGAVGLPISPRKSSSQTGPGGASSTGMGLPRLHDDQPQGAQGTQLMSHAVLRQAGVPMPQRPSPTAPGAPTPAAMTPMPGSMKQSSPGSSPSSSAQQVQPPAQPGEQADLTTVYRRDKQSGATGPQPKPRGRGLMILGVIVFAVVGFALAAALLHFLRPAP
jgi:serine/threonine-protein kinase